MKGTDGSVIIEARIDTKQFDKDLEGLENELRKRKEELLVKTQEENRSGALITYDTSKLSQEEKQELEEIDRQLDEITLKEYKQWELEQQKNQEIQKQAVVQKEINSNVNQWNNGVMTLTDGTRIVKKDMEDVNNTSKQTNDSFQNIGRSLNNIIKKVVKWGLAVFGVRSAYLAIRQAMSTLSQYDKTLGANIQYIKYALAMVIKPLIDWIVNAVYKLLQYVNYIAQAWFGINLFANASVKNFNKANGAAKKLQKTLAGFDEMNILNSNNDSGGGGGIPSFDLTRTDVPIPKWVQWIADHKDLILTVLGALAATFAAATIAKWVSNLGGLATALGFGATGILGLLTSIATIGAIVVTIMIAKAWWDDVQNFNKQLDEMRERGAKYQEEWIKKETDINKLINTGNANRAAGNELLEQSNNWLLKISGNDDKLIQQAEQVAINIGKQIDKEIELWKQQGKNEEQGEKIKNNIIEQIKYNTDVIQKLRENGMETKQVENLNKNLIEQYKNMGGKVDYVEDELGNINKIRIEDKNMTINIDANTNEAEKETESWFQKLKKGIKKALEFGMYGVEINPNAKGAIYYPPKLAVGGVINQPGRGIPLGSAIGGERGAEGVIPLTDSQQMELLGEAIGRYININLTNITELDGRQIARKVDKVRNNNNFVMNR